jgi:hypothetical protein
MSRGQENQVFNQAQGQNATAAKNAQTSYNTAQSDIGNYQDQLAKFAAGNPYGEGGQYQTAQNEVLSNTADAMGRSAGEALQGAAVRGGMNAGAGIAATEAMQQNNERNLAAQEAKANEQRIGAGAQYGADVMKASAVPAQIETSLTGQQLNAQDNTLGTQERAAQTPSLMDELGNGIVNAGQTFAKSFAAAHGCWIAARLFGGWNDPRTRKVRLWVFGPFAETWYGWLPAALYARFGETIADKWMPRSPLLTRVLRKVFEAALRRAEAWENTEDGFRAIHPFDHYSKIAKAGIR